MLWACSAGLVRMPSRPLRSCRVGTSDLRAIVNCMLWPLPPHFLTQPSAADWTAERVPVDGGDEMLPCVRSSGHHMLPSHRPLAAYANHAHLNRQYDRIIARICCTPRCRRPLASVAAACATAYTPLPLQQY